MKTIFPKSYQGNIHIPASKSDSQRTIIAAGLSQGISLLKNVGKSKDEQVMLNFIQLIGAKITLLSEGELQIEGTTHFPETANIDCGESGLSTRLIVSICAAHQGVFNIEGEGSLLKRPMLFFEKYLPELGAKINSEEGFLPLCIEGPMSGKKIEIDASEGSQYLSGLLMALPLLTENSELKVSKLVSKPYIEMTLKTLRQFGIEIQNEGLEQFTITGKQHYRATNYNIEGDWSSASYWLVASALGFPITVSGLKKDSLQADKAILKAFELANCKAIWQDDKLTIDGTNRKAFSFDATDCPDLFPALTTFAALCEGISEIKGVHRLQHKESNRALALQNEFAKLGVLIEFQDDLLRIDGGKKFQGATVSSHNDHRIAMCLAIAGMFATEVIQISGEDAVNKSYPDFWKDLESLTQKL